MNVLPGGESNMIDLNEATCVHSRNAPCRESNSAADITQEMH